MPDDITDEEKKAKAKNRLHGLIVSSVDGVKAGANKEKEWLIMKTDEQQDKENADKAEWSTAYINELPDQNFLFIESGGKKDDEGKTTPRSLRHLPYKDENGKVDLPHIRNAIARIPQLEAGGLSQDDKDKLQERARGILEDAQKEDTNKSADDGAKEPPMPVKIEKMDEKLDRARDILWGAMDKLRERLNPTDIAAQNAVLDAVVAAVGGEDTNVLMYAGEDGVEKAQDAIVEAIAKVLETEPVAKSAIAVGLRPVDPAPSQTETEQNVQQESEDINKAGKKQMSNKRAKRWRETMGAMVKLLREMDPDLEKETLWPVPQAKSAEEEQSQATEQSEVEKRAETLEAENARLRSELAKAQRRPVPSNLQTDEQPIVPVGKGNGAPRLNRMDLNEGI